MVKNQEHVQGKDLMATIKSVRKNKGTQIGQSELHAKLAAAEVANASGLKVCAGGLEIHEFLFITASQPGGVLGTVDAQLVDENGNWHSIEFKAMHLLNGLHKGTVKHAGIGFYACNFTWIRTIRELPLTEYTLDYFLDES